MSVRSIVDMADNISGIIRGLEVLGMRVEVGDDFSVYRSYRSFCTGRSELSPVFDTTRSFIDESNGFWICGFDRDDELVHTQAARLLDLPGISLGKHLDMHRHKYIVPDTTPDPDLTFFSGPEALKSVTGSVGYHGDFWLPARGLGGPRSQGATGFLSRLLFEILHQAWRPDFVFAFVPKQLAAKGAQLRYGYSHCEPGKWIGPDQQVTNEEYLVSMSASDIQNVVGSKVQPLQLSGQVSSIGVSLTSIESKN
jgi:hypothetical protein